MKSSELELQSRAVENRGETLSVRGQIEILEALKASESKYRRLFNSIRDAILVANSQREIIDCNEAFTHLFGYQLEEIAGRKTEAVYANQKEYQDLGRALRENQGKENFFSIVRYRKQSGEVFPGETNVFYQRSAEGEIEAFIGLIRDVTEQLATREELRQERDLLGRIMETSPVGMVVFDSQGRVQYLNQRGQHMVDLPAGGEPESMSWLKDHPLWLDIVQRVQDSGEVIRQNRIEVHRGQEILTIAVNAAPLQQSAGRKPGVVAAFEDVSQQVERELEYQSRLTREIHILRELVTSRTYPITAQALGLRPLQETVPESYEKSQEEYDGLLDLALEEKVYQVEHQLSSRLRELAGRLGALRAAPRDLINLHTRSLESKRGKVTDQKLTAYSREGRLILLELMGYLTAYYRVQSLGTRSEEIEWSPKRGSSSKIEGGKDE